MLILVLLISSGQIVKNSWQYVWTFKAYMQLCDIDYTVQR